jgi:hypothetical protein
MPTEEAPQTCTNRLMPAEIIQHHHGVGTLGYLRADFFEMFAHCLDADC